MLPARWREAGAAGSPQCHPGLGKAVNRSAEAVFWNCPAERLSHQSCVDRGGRNPTAWLQAREAGLQADHRLTGGSILLAKAGEFSLKTLYPARKVPEVIVLEEGKGLLVCKLLTLDKGSIGLMWGPRQG